jgi:hypothetical protein
LAELLHRVRSLVLEGALGRHVLTVWNTYKDLACQGGCPWSAMASHTPLDLSAVGREPSWILAGALYAPSRLHAEAAQEALLSLRTTVQDLRLLDPDSGVAVEAVPRCWAPHSSEYEVRLLAEAFFSTGPGQTGTRSLRRVSTLPSATGRPRRRTGTQTIEELVLGHGYEPQIGFDLSDPRTIEAFVTIAYDRETRRGRTGQ